MNNDDIIKLAIKHTTHGLKFDEDGLLRFAKLVAQHERETCAKIADTAEPYKSADLIRARGQA
jgi:hypothetical protein